VPVLAEVVLNVLQTVKRGHFLRPLVLAGLTSRVVGRVLMRSSRARLGTCALGALARLLRRARRFACVWALRLDSLFPQKLSFPLLRRRSLLRAAVRDIVLLCRLHFSFVRLLWILLCRWISL